MKRINEMINMLTRWNMPYQHQDDANTLHHIKYGITRLQPYSNHCQYLYPEKTLYTALPDPIAGIRD